MRENITYNRVDNEYIDKLLNLSAENNLIVDCYEGCLLDKSIIYNNNVIIIDGHIRKYIIIDTVYLNAWLSAYKVIMTDDDNLVDEFIRENEDDTRYEVM